MHKSDIYYRIPTLSDESLQHEEQIYRRAAETRECKGNFNYNQRIHIRICMEIYQRGPKPAPITEQS
jgi:hypothetical protein